jgi:hypothetical protein
LCHHPADLTHVVQLSRTRIEHYLCYQFNRNITPSVENPLRSLGPFVGKAPVKAKLRKS